MPSQDDLFTSKRVGRTVSSDVLPHMRILAHTRMGRPIRVWDIPYAYGPILCPIRVWVSHMSMHA